MASSITTEAFQHAKGDISRLTVVQLKSVVRGDGLTVTGTKGLLQERIKSRLTDYFNRNDIQGFQRVRNLISNATRTPSTSTFGFPPTSTPPVPPHLSRIGGSDMQPLNSFPSPMATYAPARPNFKNSPFYEIEKPLSPVEHSKPTDGNRSNLELKLQLSPEVASIFSRDNDQRASMRIMVFCSQEPISSFIKSDVAFPNQIELRVNGTEVRANLRGLKNRPGSTRPADITDMLRKTANYENHITALYAPTTKKYYFVVNLVRQTSAEYLVQKLQEGRSISKDQIIGEMMGKAQDTELEATSTIMSLKCPLSTLRIVTPCRSNICTHNQCFDALSFLQLQQQAPTWTCPVCNRNVSFEALQVDQYVNDILTKTAQTVEQVTISPSGQWAIIDPSEAKNRSAPPRATSDNDDLIEIPDHPTEKTSPSFHVSRFPAPTPPVSSREESVASVAARSHAGKRQHSAVIDLTLSDDEDPPARDPKRLATSPSSLKNRLSPGARSTPFNTNSRNDSLGYGYSNPISQHHSGMEFAFPRDR